MVVINLLLRSAPRCSLLSLYSPNSIAGARLHFVVGERYRRTAAHRQSIAKGAASRKVARRARTATARKSRPRRPEGPSKARLASQTSQASDRSRLEEEDGDLLGRHARELLGPSRNPASAALLPPSGAAVHGCYPARQRGGCETLLTCVCVSL